MEMAETDTASGKTTLDQRHWYQAGSVRIEMADGDLTIFRDNQLFVFDARSKTYSIVDPQQMGSQISDLQRKQREQLAKLPPPQRAQMEAMMAELMQQGAKVDVVDTGRSERFEGQNCRIWQV
ncbi:MAG: hypothetical protein RML32_05465, partial [Gammaproteobacteria bacterium]|nr:hypothetical protein [Gammaproteobacteria bacterium]